MSMRYAITRVLRDVAILIYDVGARRHSRRASDYVDAGDMLPRARF